MFSRLVYTVRRGNHVNNLSYSLFLRKFCDSSKLYPPGWPRLDQHLKLSTVEHLSNDELAELWVHFWQQKPENVSGVISDAKSVYLPMYRRLEESPMFVVPVPTTQEGSGGEGTSADQQHSDNAGNQETTTKKKQSDDMLVLLMQAQFLPPADRVPGAPAYPCNLFFTSVAEYRDNPAAARTFLQVSYFTELVANRNMILMHGESTILTSAQAAYAVNVIKLCYLNDASYALPRQFNHEPDRFEMDALYEEINNLALSQ